MKNFWERFSPETSKIAVFAENCDKNNQKFFEKSVSQTRKTKWKDEKVSVTKKNNNQ